MQKSASITQLAAALAKAQGELRPAEMTATNPFLKNRYADLGAVIQASKPTLAKYGLSVVQPVSGNGEVITVTTLLMHESGEWIEETISLPLGEERGKSQAQVAGSIVTYLRRYSLASMLGMYADEDADGEQPKLNGKPAQAPVRVHQPPAAIVAEPPATIEQQFTKPANGNGKPAPAAPKMSRETAENILNSEGIRYGDLPSDKLEMMPLGIRKGLQKTGLTIEQRETYQMKLDAIEVILTAREQEDDEARAAMNE